MNSFYRFMFTSHIYLYLTNAVVKLSQWPNSGHSSARRRNAALWYAISNKIMAFIVSYVLFLKQCVPKQCSGKYFARIQSEKLWETVLFHHYIFFVVRDSSVGIAPGYGLDGPGIESRWGTTFFAHVQTGPGAHPASCTMGTGSFPGLKRQGRAADHKPPSSAEVSKGYSYTSIHLLGLFRPVMGLL
jgi:hypothetical protein